MTHSSKAVGSDSVAQRILKAEQRHDALPSKDKTELPAVDWANVEDYQPRPIPTSVPPNSPLPQADFAVVTWTQAEWAAMQHVFCGKGQAMTVADVHKGLWESGWTKYQRDYDQIHQYMVDVKRTYQGGAPSLMNNAWGYYHVVEVNGKSVLLIKSDMHLAQDGTNLPLKRFIDRICLEAKPKLLLSIGTAGGVRTEDALGCALITNQAYFHLLEEFAGASFNHTTVRSRWQPNDKFISAAQKRTIQVCGFPVLPLSPQYPTGSIIEPNSPDSVIKIVVDQPIITTDSFLFGTTRNDLARYGCIVEMDDAVVGQCCQNAGVAFGFVRNVSDPVINAELPDKVQEVWAQYIYTERGLFTSYNGALAAWALIAAECAA